MADEKILGMWRDRLVKVSGGMIMFSAAGRPDDWDFYPNEVSDTMAVAIGGLGQGPMILTEEPEAVADAQIRGPDAIALLGSRGGRYLLTGNPAGDDGRIDPDPPAKTPETPGTPAGPAPRP